MYFTIGFMTLWLWPLILFFYWRWYAGEPLSKESVSSITAIIGIHLMVAALSFLFWSVYVVAILVIGAAELLHKRDSKKLPQGWWN